MEKSRKRLNGFIAAGCQDPLAFWSQTPIVVPDFRRGVKGDRIGFVNVFFPDLGLQIDDCPVHRQSISGRCWIMPPARVLENADGTLAIDRHTGRPFFIDPAWVILKSIVSRSSLAG
jgi:hypothetical protein